MGRMIDGKWTTEWYTPDAQGRFVRGETVFRSRLSRDGSTGLSPVPGRFHLYVSLACPWAHRTLIVRALLGLSRAISISVVNPLMAEDGWTFDDSPGTIPDTVTGARFLRDVYAKSNPTYTGRVTVPILWDRQTGTIVNNESREIITMLATEWGDSPASPDIEGVGGLERGVGGGVEGGSGGGGRARISGSTLYPEALRAKIDETITAIYTPINNGV